MRNGGGDSRDEGIRMKSFSMAKLFSHRRLIVAVRIPSVLSELRLAL